MKRPDRRLVPAALILGFLLIPARVLIMLFFPVFNLGEMILFALAAALLAYCFRAEPSWWVVALFLPAFLFVLYMVIFLLGLSSLSRGIGVGHVLSLVLIPLSTFCGAHYGSKTAGESLEVQL